jgi:hypothetical protein
MTVDGMETKETTSRRYSSPLVRASWTRYAC